MILNIFKILIIVLIAQFNDITPFIFYHAVHDSESVKH